MESVMAQQQSARRREQLRRLLRMQRAAEHLATAQFLEHQADAAATPVLASLLRERASERRWWAELLRSEVPGAGGGRPAPS